MSEAPVSILISGQGVAGTSLALILARNASSDSTGPKPKITLIERSPVARTTGQAVDIREPAVSLIRLLGLEEKIKQRHTSETGIAFVDAQGNEFARFDATGDAEHQSATSEYEILRGDLTSLLLEELEKTSGQADVSVVYGESVKSLAEDASGVKVEFANGKLDTQKFDAVIAADGMSSRTRGMIFDEYASGECIQSLGQYIAFFTVPRVDEDVDRWHWYVAPGGLGIHIRPHRNKTTMGVYLSITNGTRSRIPEVDDILLKDVEAQKKFLRSKFAGIGFQSERFLDAMDKAEDFYMQQTAMVVTPKWSKGRCTLLGDAAYCTMGIGTTLAMTGAYVIAGELAKVEPGDPDGVLKALSRYENTFRPLVEKSQKMPPGVPQLANPQTRVGIEVMRMMLRFFTWTGLHRLLQSFSGASEQKWKLPKYDL